jgi:molybdenum cofactor cytidylyltransferase
MNTGIVILAAGDSSRLGKPKQLLTYQEKTFLEIVSDTAIKTDLKPVVVVLGAFANDILKQQKQPGITYIINDSWQDGMSSSISAGVSAILGNQRDLENIIIAVADQVFITSAIFKDLIEKQGKTGKNIIASSYAQTLGTPALFNKMYFEQLISLKGDIGAKNILMQHPDDTETITFDQGNIDIDTEADYNNLIKD